MSLTPNYKHRWCISLILVYVMCISTYSQKAVDVKIEKGERIWIESYVGEQLRIASDKNLYAYSATGELLWKKPFHESYNVVSNLTITSPSASNTFKVSFKGNVWNTYNDKPARVTQISKDGTIKSFEIPGKKEFGKNLLTIFCDDQYLYYLTTKEGDEQHVDKRVKEKLLLNRFSSDQSYQQFEIDVPPLPASDYSWVFWSYAGHINGLHYVMAKGWIVEDETEHAAIKLIGFNADGEVKVRKEITTILKDRFMRPVSMRQNGLSYVSYENQDFEIPAVPSNTSSKTVTMRPMAQTSGAFVGFQIDPIHQCFYAYGLVGPKAFKRLAPEYDGFYVVKYDLEGNEIWRLQHIGDAELVGERIFFRGAAPAFRGMLLDAQADGRLRVKITWPKGEASFYVSETGQVDKQAGKSAASDFIDSRTDKDKNISYRILYMTTGNVVVRWNDKDDSPQLFFFPKE